MITTGSDVITLQVKKLHPDAKLPTVAHPGKDLGFDLYALEDERLFPGKVQRVRTGVAVAMEGHGFRIADRSSMAMKGCHISGGVIDEGYTGEMFVNITYNPEGQPWKDYLEISAGDKVAQFIPQEVRTAQPIVEVEALPESARGESGYGSTGK